MTTPFYTPLTWIDTASGNTPLSSANLNRMEQGINNAFLRIATLVLNPTVIRTGNFTISANDLGRFDATATPITSTLPPAVAGMLIAVKKLDITTNAVTFNPAGTDTVDGVSQSVVLRLQHETRTLLGITGGWLSLSSNNTVVSLDNRYANPPMFYAVQAVAQSLANSTSTAITFTTEVYDSPAAHSLVTNTSRYTCVQAGWYQVSGCVNYVNPGTPVGTRGAMIYKNGVEYPGGSSLVGPAPNFQSRVSTPTVLMPLALNDYVEIFGYHVQGASLSTDISGSGSSFTMLYVHP